MHIFFRCAIIKSMKGLIFINAYFKSEEYLYQPKRLQEEFSRLGIAVDIRSGESLPVRIDGNELKTTLAPYDFCLFFDKDKYLLKAFSKVLPLFNGYEPIITCDDKMLTCLALADQGIPLPKTVPGLLCFSPSEKVSLPFLENLERTLSYPLVVKEAYGSLGKGVYLVHDRAELTATLESVKCRPHLFQEFIRSSYGKDVRVIVIGGKAVGGMLRRSEKNFRSNLGAGGSAAPYPLTAEMTAIAEKVANTLSLDYCGIDFLFGEEGSIVCEVNSNAFFGGFEQCTKINVAKLYAEHILEKLSK